MVGTQSVEPFALAREAMVGHLLINLKVGQIGWCDMILRGPPSRVPGVIFPRYLMQLCQYSHH